MIYLFRVRKPSEKLYNNGRGEIITLEMVYGLPRRRGCLVALPKHAPPSPTGPFGGALVAALAPARFEANARHGDQPPPLVG